MNITCCKCLVIHNNSEAEIPLKLAGCVTGHNAGQVSLKGNSLVLIYILATQQMLALSSGVLTHCLVIYFLLRKSVKDSKTFCNYFLPSPVKLC